MGYQQSPFRQAKVQAGGILRKSLDNSWRTPESILDRVRVFFGGQIPLDPATSPDNPTGAAVFCAGIGPLFADGTPAKASGLDLPWDAPTWVNPPYGASLRAWLGKMVAEAKRVRARPIVTLLPCSRWEMPYLTALFGDALVCFHRGRVKFISSLDGKPVSGNPGANMIVGLNADEGRFIEAFGPLGPCFRMTEIARRA